MSDHITQRTRIYLTGDGARRRGRAEEVRDGVPDKVSAKV